MSSNNQRSHHQGGGNPRPYSRRRVLLKSTSGHSTRSGESWGPGSIHSNAADAPTRPTTTTGASTSRRGIRILAPPSRRVDSGEDELFATEQPPAPPARHVTGAAGVAGLPSVAPSPGRRGYLVRMESSTSTQAELDGLATVCSVKSFASRSPARPRAPGAGGWLSSSSHHRRNLLLGGASKHSGSPTSLERQTSWDGSSCLSTTSSHIASAMKYYDPKNNRMAAAGGASGRPDNPVGMWLRQQVSTGSLDSSSTHTLRNSSFHTARFAPSTAAVFAAPAISTPSPQAYHHQQPSAGNEQQQQFYPHPPAVAAPYYATSPQYQAAVVGGVSAHSDPTMATLGHHQPGAALLQPQGFFPARPPPASAAYHSFHPFRRASM